MCEGRQNDIQMYLPPEKTLDEIEMIGGWVRKRVHVLYTSPV